MSPHSPGMSGPESLQHQVFENTLQPHFILNNVNGRIIMVNLAACDLVGYSCEELLNKEGKLLFRYDKSLFTVMTKRRSPTLGRRTMNIIAIRKDGIEVPCEMTPVPLIANDGTENVIFALVDMSDVIRKQNLIDKRNQKAVADDISLAKAMQKLIDIKREKQAVDDIIFAVAVSDARLTENNEWKKYIGKTSYDVMWDWEVGSKKIYVSDSIFEVFGYKVSNNHISVRDFQKRLLPSERKGIEKRIVEALKSRKKVWEEAFEFKLENGTFASAMIRASIVRDSNGMATRLIGALQNVSQLELLEKRLRDQIVVQKELAEIFHVASKLSFDGRWDWNLINGDFKLGEGFKELFGYASTKSKGKIARDWARYIHPHDRERVEQTIRNAIASNAAAWEQTYRFIKADGSIAQVVNRATIIRNVDGAACRIIGAMHDISTQKGLEDRLDREMRMKQQQIADAAEDAKEAERSGIGKELHDNVNQLLGVSRLYLDLAQKGGDKSSDFMKKSSEYTLTAIEEIRKLTRSLTTDVIENLGLKQAITNIARETMLLQKIIVTCSLKTFVEDSVENKLKLNIFRIVQEQLNNILKHSKATTVSITLAQRKQKIILNIHDNGVGFDLSQKREGIGIENLKERAAAFNGTTEIITSKGNGCRVITSFGV